MAGKSGDKPQSAIAGGLDHISPLYGRYRTDSIGNRISDDHTITATDCPLDLKGYMNMDIRNRRQQLHEIKAAI